jgi:GIY-YIG catalytic domain
MAIQKPANVASPPFETAELRKSLSAFLGQKVSGLDYPDVRTLGNFRFGVYAFYDYDGEPIYVGQTNERLSTRIRRHLTNQRTDAVAMKILDPFEVGEIEVWPLPAHQGKDKSDMAAKAELSGLESAIFWRLLGQSRFNAVLNEKAPFGVADTDFAAQKKSWRGKIVSDEVHALRSHPDTRIARRAETLSLLAKVISERQVQKGLRKTLLVQAQRLAWLAHQRLDQLQGLPDLPEDSSD